MALSGLKAFLTGGGVEIKSALAAGASADTDIAIGGWSWAKDPQIIAILHFSTAAAIATLDDRQTELARGAGDDDIQLDTTDTTNDQLLVIWAQRA